MFKRAVGVLKSNLDEFKDFAFKGNLLQLAIGVVLGTAFGDVIKSFVDNIFMPLISIFHADAAKGAGYIHWQFAGVKYGMFLGDLLRFLIIAFAIFLLMVKVIGLIVRLAAKRAAEKEAAAPTEKDCPYCLMKVPYLARKCGHCTSELPGILQPEPAAPSTPAASA